MSREEIAKLFEVTANLKAPSTADDRLGGRTRGSEVACLKVTDIDSQRMTLQADPGKEAKDRYTLLSKRLLFS